MRLELEWESFSLDGLEWLGVDAEFSETLCCRFCEISGLVNWDLISSSSGSLESEVLVHDLEDILQFSDELDCSDSTDMVVMFKDSSFLIKILSFFSAFFLSLVSSLSWFSSSINCTLPNTFESKLENFFLFFENVNVYLH